MLPLLDVLSASFPFMALEATSAGKCAEKGMAEQVCGNYTTITDRHGRSALKGAVAFEGYGACKTALTSIQY